MGKVLVIDDDELICTMLSHRIMRLGHTVEVAFSLSDGEEKVYTGSFDVIFLDIHLPDGNGLEILPRIQRVASSPEVIIITAVDDPNGAELALNNGAWDYIKKPFTKEEVNLQLIRALQYREGKRKAQAPMVLKKDGLLGKSPRISACFDILAQAAQSHANVLIKGETGTGKELFARAIHENSLRADGPFLIVDCTILPENLVESMLFGHEKGSFTGAERAHKGLIKQADGGTLFLDEIGELPLNIQKAFLRVLQERRFRSIGAKEEITSDFRLVSATNRDLGNMVKSGQFRQDLLFRLQTLTIEIPPLRERAEDIKDIAIYHISRLCELSGVESKGFSPELLDMLVAYNWPGNVRELVNILERAIAIEPHNPILYPKNLPSYIRAKVINTSSPHEKTLSTIAQKYIFDRPQQYLKLKDFRERCMVELERQYLDKLLLMTNGDVKESCQISGLSRTRFYELLKKHKIFRQAKKAPNT